MYEKFMYFPDEYKEVLKKQNKKLKKEYEKKYEKDLRAREKELDNLIGSKLEFGIDFEAQHVLIIILGIGFFIALVRIFFLFKKFGAHLWVFEECLRTLLTSIIIAVIFVTVIWIIYQVQFYKKEKYLEKQIENLSIDDYVNKSLDYKKEVQIYSKQYRDKLPEVCYTVLNDNDTIKLLAEKIFSNILCENIEYDYSEYEPIKENLVFDINKSEIMCSGEVIYKFENDLSSAIEVTAIAIVLASQVQLLLSQKYGKSSGSYRNYYFAKLNGYTKSEVIFLRK